MIEINSLIEESKMLPLEGEDPDEFIDWADAVGLEYLSDRHECLAFYSRGEWFLVEPGQYVILDEWGDFYVSNSLDNLNWVEE